MPRKRKALSQPIKVSSKKAKPPKKGAKKLDLANRGLWLLPQDCVLIIENYIDTHRFFTVEAFEVYEEKIQSSWPTLVKDLATRCIWQDPKSDSWRQILKSLSPWKKDGIEKRRRLPLGHYEELVKVFNLTVNVENKSSSSAINESIESFYYHVKARSKQGRSDIMPNEGHVYPELVHWEKSLTYMMEQTPSYLRQYSNLLNCKNITEVFLFYLTCRYTGENATSFTRRELPEYGLFYVWFLQNDFHGTRLTCTFWQYMSYLLAKGYGVRGLIWFLYLIQQVHCHRISEDAILVYLKPGAEWIYAKRIFLPS